MGVRKNTARYKENLKKKVLEHLTAIEIIEHEETEEYGKSDLPETGNGIPINSESIREAVAKIDEKLTEKPTDKELKRAK